LASLLQNSELALDPPFILIKKTPADSRRLIFDMVRRVRELPGVTARDSSERILYSVFYRMNQYWAKHPPKPFTQNP
jgi:hypothetical protein